MSYFLKIPQSANPWDYNAFWPSLMIIAFFFFFFFFFLAPSSRMAKLVHFHLLILIQLLAGLSIDQAPTEVCADGQSVEREVAKGEEIWSKMPKSDDRRTDKGPGFIDPTTWTVEKANKLGPALLIFKKLGIIDANSAKKQFSERSFESRSRYPGFKYRNTYSRDCDTIVATSVPADPSVWSDLTFPSWREVCTRNVNELKHIDVHSNISDIMQTRALIDLLIDEKPQAGQLRSLTFTPEHNNFYGTFHTCARLTLKPGKLLYMLILLLSALLPAAGPAILAIHYPGSLGAKIVTSITIYRHVARRLFIFKGTQTYYMTVRLGNLKLSGQALVRSMATKGKQTSAKMPKKGDTLIDKATQSVGELEKNWLLQYSADKISPDRYDEGVLLKLPNLREFRGTFQRVQAEFKHPYYVVEADSGTTVYVNMFSCVAGVILAIDNSRRDSSAGHWSDVIFAIWKDKCGNGILRYIVQSQVTNEISRNLIDYLVPKGGLERNRRLPSTSKRFLPNDDGFYGMLH